MCKYVSSSKYSFRGYRGVPVVNLKRNRWNHGLASRVWRGANPLFSALAKLRLLYGWTGNFLDMMELCSDGIWEVVVKKISILIPAEVACKAHHLGSPQKAALASERWGMGKIFGVRPWGMDPLSELSQSSFMPVVHNSLTRVRHMGMCSFYSERMPDYCCIMNH